MAALTSSPVSPTTTPTLRTPARSSSDPNSLPMPLNV
jgi:hypothetical protein